jgi:hypothetical protein
MVDLVDGRNLVLVALGYHFVLEGPASAAGEFGDYHVAVSEEIDIEIYVVDGLSKVSEEPTGNGR